MIDIHSHIVFDVDDGPKSLEESKALLTEAYRQGVRTVVSTSHRRKGMFETPEEKILDHFLAVKEIAKEIGDDFDILYGGELYFTSDILDKLENKQIPTLNGTRFALIEFSMTTPWKEIHDALSKVLMLGITPVVAHIERYNALEFNEERVTELIRMGCYTQVNSAHVLKPKFFGDKVKVFKKRVKYFLDRDLVHIVSSDMHNLEQRPPYMQEAYKYVFNEYGKGRAKDLFEINARALLDNEFI